MTYLAQALGQPLTSVVHVREPHDVYIGRAMPGRTASQLCNPYRIGPDGTRKDVILKFKEYAQERLANDPEFALALRAVRGRRMGCWCKPDDCHGDVLLWLLGEGPEPFADFQQALF